MGKPSWFVEFTRSLWHLIWIGREYSVRRRQIIKFLAQQNLKPFLFWNFFESAKSCWSKEVRWSNSLTFSKEQLDGSSIEFSDTLQASFRAFITCSFTILVVNLQTIGRGPEIAILVGIRWAISMSWSEISIPAALKRLIHREAVWEADLCVSPFGRPIILILYWKLYLCSC